MVRRFVWYAAVIVAAFLLGFFPMWLSARARASERDAAQQALRLSRIENRLARAAIDARRGDYEPARAAASAFYTELRMEIDRDDSALPPPPHDALQSLLSDRDEMITLLARNDPAVAERLSQAHVSYREAVGRASP